MTGWRAALCLLPVLSLASHRSLQHLFILVSALSGEHWTLKPGWTTGGGAPGVGLPPRLPMPQPRTLTWARLGPSLEGLLHPLSLYLSPCPPVLSSSVPVTVFQGQFSGSTAHEHSPTSSSLPRRTTGRGSGSLQSLNPLPLGSPTPAPCPSNLPTPLGFTDEHKGRRQTTTRTTLASNLFPV